MLDDQGFSVLLDSSNFSNIPLVVGNDADLAGLGEAVIGAGRDYNRVVFLTLSTGVGGTVIEGKKPDDTGRKGKNFSFNRGFHPPTH